MGVRAPATADYAALFFGLMARPPLYERSVDATRDVTAVKVAIKHLEPDDRAHLIAWLLLYYDDGGSMFSPRTGRRRRATIDDVDYWLVRLPKR